MQPSHPAGGDERGGVPTDTGLSALPSYLRGMLDLLSQVAQTTGEVQLEVLSRKGLRIATLPVSQRHVLFGVTIDGLFFVDRLFDQQSPAIAAPLRLYQQQQILQPGREEFPKLEMLEQSRPALLELTARSLRSLGGRLAGSPIKLKQSPPSATIGMSANLRFSLLELLLNRPEMLSLRSDSIAQLFQHPPQGTTDAWLFLLGEPVQMWPVATINTGLKSIKDATVACQMAYGLLQLLKKQSVTLDPTRNHAVCISGDGALLLMIANANQAVLLTVPAAQFGRVLQLTQSSCILGNEPPTEAAVKTAQPVPLTAETKDAIPAPSETVQEPARDTASLPKAEPTPPQPAASLAPMVHDGVRPVDPQPDDQTPAAESESRPAANLGPVLTVHDLGVKAADKTLLKGVSFEIPPRGVFAMMGPGGAGKSTLLGILSGGIAGLTPTGTMSYLGAELTNGHHPLVLSQKVRLGSGTLLEELLSKPAPHSARDYLQAAELLRGAGLERLRSSLDRPLSTLSLSTSQQWRIAILHAIVKNPPLLCVDEPTAGMDDEDAKQILNLIREQSSQRAILFVTHNQEHARQIADSVALMAAAQLHGVYQTATFFGEDASPLVREYVRTGGCHVPSPDAPLEHIDPDYLKPPPPLALPVMEPEPVLMAPPSDVLWKTANPLLELKDFSLTMGARCRLQQVNLQMESRGAYQLVCPDGTIRRLLHAFLSSGVQGKISVQGVYTLAGHPIDEDHHAATVELNVKLLMNSVREYLLSGYPQRMSLTSIDEKHSFVESHLTAQNALDLMESLSSQVLDLSSEQKRRLAIARAAASSPPLLVLEEPLQGLDPESAVKVLQTITEESARRAVLVLTAEAIPQWERFAKIGYIYGEYLYPTPPPVVVESPPAEQTAPAAQSAAQETVSQPDSVTIKEPIAAPLPAVDPVSTVSEPTPAADPYVHPEPTPEPPMQRRYGQGPRGFHWLLPGVLAGTPEPGMMHDLEYDLSLLRTAGITLLVTLTETPLDDEVLEAQGIKSLFFPIVDMHAPSQRAAYDLCGLIELQIQRGERIAFHCKAGLGRTGTLLCAYLIWKGEAAQAALERARRVEPAWVQSREQEKFLQDFESFCTKQKQST